MLIEVTSVRGLQFVRTVLYKACLSLALYERIALVCFLSCLV